MGKFNKSAFGSFKPQAGQIGKTGNLTSGANMNHATIGTGLLSSASKEQVQKKWKDTVALSIEDVSDNKNNKYSQNEIEELAQNIYMVGLDQYFVVRPDYDNKDQYILIAGHRRLKAIKLLKERGQWGEYIPCIVKDPAGIDLPLSFEDKERLAIMSTNIEARNNTEYDKMMEMRDYMDIVDKLRKAGYEELDGLRIRNVKTRTLLSEKYNISEGTAAKYLRVSNNASEEVLSEMKEGNLSLNVANEIVKEPEEVQKEIIEKIQETAEDDEEKVAITKEKVEQVKNNVKEEVSIILDQKQWEEDTKEIVQNLGILLSEKKYKKYQKAIDDIKKLICS